MIQNCFSCRLPSYHASVPASGESPREPAWFQCPEHGKVGSDAIGTDFECPSWLDRDGHPVTIHSKDAPPFLAFPPSSPEIGADLLALAWRIKHGAGQAGGA